VTTTPAAIPTVPAINMVKPFLPTFEELEAGVREILTTGMVTKGHFLRDFEEAVAGHLGVGNAVGVSSCTAGLMLAYQALGLEGEVIVPSFTFMATVSSLVWAGLTPVFADVDPHTTNVTPQVVESVITERTSAIVAVHNFGNPANIDALQEIAKRRGLKLIFDAAHGFGTLYEDVPVGPQGDAQSFSLSPTKLVIAGEGGIVATDDDGLADRIRIGREYGNSGAYDSAFAGMNARMPEFSALLGHLSLQRLPAAVARRNEIAEIFREGLGALPGIGFQRVRPEDRSSYKDFSITIDPMEFGMSREHLAASLRLRGIDSRTYYDPPVHRHTAYRRFGASSYLPHTETLSQRSLSLPIWSAMNDETATYIVQALAAARSDHAPR
jgi:dTDP-4-amino-4,6-dideoxygalactose transaminase